LTRIVNFINDELVGNVCVPDHPWCMKFPSRRGLPVSLADLRVAARYRVLPIVLLVYRRRPPDGVVAWTWFALYGVTRSLAEIWRQTDLAVGPLTGGQLLALPMIVIGLLLVARAARGGHHTDVAPAWVPDARI
jgi:prolipoprotein diacylglyceryltransferase